MSDKLLRQEIIDELDFDPSVQSAHIGVAVDDGVVTLSGHVSSYAEKIAAERAVQRVKGVKAIAEEIEIRYPGDKRTADDQIAKRAVDIIAWDTTIPSNRIAVKVQDGWVTLDGDADWNFQKTDAERAVRRLTGVVGISNMIRIKPRVAADDVKSRIEKALKRSAEIDADTIKVRADGGKVVLEGRVKAWHERDLAEKTAWAAPGVTAVEDRIRIE
jgi:osmotically-inducible protein OsmY